MGIVLRKIRYELFKGLIILLFSYWSSHNCFKAGVSGRVAAQIRSRAIGSEKMQPRAATDAE